MQIKKRYRKSIPFVIFFIVILFLGGCPTPETVTDNSSDPVSNKLPTFAATSMQFVDSDDDTGEVSGQIMISMAANEDNITHYLVYWGSSSTEKLPGEPEIAAIAKAGVNLTYILFENTPMPAGATHLLVFTRNEFGEMETGISVTIVDAGAPEFGAMSLGFSDDDTDAQQISGKVSIGVAFDESTITHYVLYWGSDSTSKLEGVSEIIQIAKTGFNLDYIIPDNTPVPEGANYLMVFSKNSHKEKETGTSVLITDAGIPTNSAMSLDFTDTDVDGGQIGGELNITMAADETDITHYTVFWGIDHSTKLNGVWALASLPSRGSNLSFHVESNTAIPTGATHLLVFTGNRFGMMKTGTSLLLSDKGVPKHAPISMNFSDLDIDGGEVSGEVSIVRANDESDITDYVLYWGRDSYTKLYSQTPINTLSKTGSNLIHFFPQNTIIPDEATHLLAFSKNDDGESNAGSSAFIVDVGVPQQTASDITFTDFDQKGRKIGGDVFITKAVDESKISHYALFWGSNSTSKLEGHSLIALLPASGANPVFTFSGNTPLPEGATHLLVYSRNKHGENQVPAALLIHDTGVPTHAAISIGFTDEDVSGGEISGVLKATKAYQENDITHYVFYWGSDSNSKLDGHNEIISIAKGATLQYTFPPDSIVPTGASHFLLYTKNESGEMASGVSRPIHDIGLPASGVVSLAFSDTDDDIGQLGGSLTIVQAHDEWDITHYVVYWGKNSSEKLGGQSAISYLEATGSNLSFSFPENTFIPDGATHLLVFTQNDAGEKHEGVNVPFVDSGAPINRATELTFIDGDPDVGEISGTVAITKAEDETDISHYVLYWGSGKQTKRYANPITTLEKTGQDLIHVFADSTGIYNGATHLLLYTRNNIGEMNSPISIPLNDDGLPVNSASGVNFFDTDTNGGEIGGTLTITKATNEDDITHYLLYWGSSANDKLNGQSAIARLAKSGADLSFEFAENTAIPLEATHLLVVSAFNENEMTAAVSTPLTDLGVPINSSVGVRFFDKDPEISQLAGTVHIIKAGSEADLTHYVLYWGINESSKLEGHSPFATLPATGFDLTYTFSMNTPIPQGATHLLVFTKNDEGEMLNGVGTAIGNEDVLDKSYFVRNPTVGNGELYELAYGNGKFVATGQYGTILNSSDGVTWKGMTISEIPSHTHEFAFDSLVFDGLKFVAVNYKGEIHISVDGENWHQQKNGNLPVSFKYGVAYGNNTYVLVGNNGIFTSIDTITWTQRAAHLSIGYGLYDVSYGDGQFIAVGDSGNLVVSADGITWSQRSSGTVNRLQGVNYGGGVWIAVGWDGTISTSVDGNVWSLQSSGVSDILRDISYGNGQYVISGDNWVLHSSDSITWNATGIPYSRLYGVVYGNGKFITLGSEWYVNVLRKGVAFTSHDGINWIGHGGDVTIRKDVFDIAYGNNSYVAVGYIKDKYSNVYGNISISSDGSNWSQVDEPNYALKGVGFGNQTFVAVGGNNSIFTSHDNGQNWTLQNIGGGSQLNGVAFGSGAFVVVGQNGTLFKSTDGTSWTPFISGTNSNLNRVRFQNNLFVAIGDQGTLLTSDNGEDWTARMSSTNENLRDVTFGAGIFVVVGDNGSVSFSSNALIWQKMTVSDLDLRSVAYGNGYFIAVGEQNSSFSSSDGIYWAKRLNHPFGRNDVHANTVINAENRFLVVGEKGMIQQSEEYP